MNKVSQGKRILIPIPAGGCEDGGRFNGTIHVPGIPILIGNDLVGVPLNSFGAGASGNVNVDLEGVFANIAKKPTDTFSIGDKLYLDSGNGYLTTTSAGNVWAGWAMVNGTAADSTCTFKIKGC